MSISEWESGYYIEVMDSNGNPTTKISSKCTIFIRRISDPDFSGFGGIFADLFK